MSHMYRVKQLLVFTVDVLIMYLGLYLAVAARTGTYPGKNFIDLATPMTGLFSAAVVFLFIAGAYDLGRAKNHWPFYQKIWLSALFWTALGMAYFYVAPNEANVTPKTILALTTLFAFSLISLWRAIYNHFLARNFLKIRLAFIGYTQEVKEILSALKHQPELGYDLVGIISNRTDLPKDIRIFSSLKELIASTGLDLIVLTEGNEDKTVMAELYQQLFRHVSIITMPDLYERLFGRVPPLAFSDDWFITHLREQEKRVYDRVRTLLDYFSGLIMGLFFIITFPLIALIIKFTSPGPIFFRQTRVGRLGKTYTLIKYRTMQALAKDGSAELTGPQFAATADPRVTTFGKFLRLTRLDEIPQFYNILQGEMSLIGPRPERPEFVAELTQKMPYYSLRLLVKPGLTGWAQIHQSYYGTLEENLYKLEYDIFYIKNRGAILDLTIFLRTIKVVGSFGGR